MKTDAVILAALPKERQAVLDVLDTIATGTQYRAEGREYQIYPIRGLRIAVPQPMGMGLTYAALATADMLTDLSTKMVILTGIAGCMGERPSGDEPCLLALGDIIVSDQVIDYTLEKDKETIEQEGEGVELTVRELQPRLQVFRSSHHLVSAVRSRQAPVTTGHPDRHVDRAWQPRLAMAAPVAGSQSPAIHIGTVLSGNSVMASQAGKRKLLERVTFSPAPIAIEMESAGVLRRLIREPRQPAFLMVKSFCDWAEPPKTDDWQTYCSHVSASYSLHLILSEEKGLLRQSAHDPDEPRAEFQSKTRSALDCFTASVDLSTGALRETAEAVRRRSVDEIVQIGNDGYEVDLGTSEQFLTRAEPLFRSAQEIYATSVDSVSTFWTDPRTAPERRRYIECQRAEGRKRVARIFVFTTPESAHRHGKVLDANHAAYHNVFVCSSDHYRDLLKEMIAVDHVERYMQRDFAVLEYPEGKSYVAELDHRFLRVHPLKHERKPINARPTKELFDRLMSTLKPGDFDEDRKVLRWSEAYWDRRERWASKLNAMFEKPKADVFHTVTLDISDTVYAELRKDLASIKYELLKAGNSDGRGLAPYKIKQIWLTQRVKYDPTSSPRDGITNGRLHMPASRSRRFMLIMQFASRADLVAYYQDPIHARLRRELYAKLDPRTRVLLDRLQESPQGGGATLHVAEQYEIVEDLAAHKVRRLDYFEDELIEHMVLSEPPEL